MTHGELAPGARRAGDVARGGEGRGRRGGARKVKEDWGDVDEEAL